MLLGEEHNRYTLAYFRRKELLNDYWEWNGDVAVTDRHALLYCLSVTNDRKNLSNASVQVCVGVKWTRKQSDNCWSDDARSYTHKHTHTVILTITNCVRWKSQRFIVS